MVGKATANFGCVYPHFHNLTLYGTKATFVNDPQHACLYTSRSSADAPEIIRDPYPGTHKGDLIYSFVTSIVDSIPAEVSAADVFSAMSVCFAIEKAVQTGTTVTVQYHPGKNHGTHNTLWQADYRQRRKAGSA
jgi:predicted dehydrogenase